MSHIRIDALGFWMLDAVWRFPLSMRFFFCDYRVLSEHVNLRIPNSSLEYRINTAVSFIGKGLLQIVDSNDNLISNESVNDYLTAPLRNGSLKITSLGGMIWEQIATPDWQRYSEVAHFDPRDELPESANAVADETMGSSGEMFTLTAANLDRIIEMHQYLCLIKLKEYKQQLMIAEGLDRPWQISSWKQLPVAYWRRIEFRVRRAVSQGLDDADNKSACRWRRLGFNKSECDTLVGDFWHTELNVE
ncbi:hypothetical protein [Schlesneria paludicola]|uniref:hypothetical protein n=1 Tax=Schlesneria paludicola TaxID=360056 RepID=UPI00029A7C50|nr:hypothetical protein [Schlesneria paludicola]